MFQPDQGDICLDEKLIVPALGHLHTLSGASFIADSYVINLGVPLLRLSSHNLIPILHSETTDTNMT